MLSLVSSLNGIIGFAMPTAKEIADHLRIHYTTVSKAMSGFEKSDFSRLDHIGTTKVAILYRIDQQLKRVGQYAIVKVTLGDIANGKNNFRDSR